MMKLTVLGTGNALVTECYNTCFILDDGGQLLLVDGGGGNSVLHQIRACRYDAKQIQHRCVAEKRTDRCRGSIWMMRMI